MNRRVLIPLALVVALLVAVLLWPNPDGGDAASERTTASTTAPSEAPSTSAALIGTPGGDGVGDPYFPNLGNTGYDVDHYTLNLTWRADEGVLDGVTTIEASATQDLDRFNLDLSGMEVLAVTVEGSAAKVEREDRELVITPAAVIPAGDPFTTTITYSGRPKPVSEGTTLFDVGWQTDGREAFVVSEPSGAATFFPVNDHPTDKATYTFRVTAPADQVVAANGLLASKDDIGHGTTSWTYEARDPMASYLVQIAIGDYELVDAGEVDGVVVRHAFHRSVAAAARVTTEGTADMIRLLGDVYGPYPFEAYGVLAVDENLGFALETQTFTLIGTSTARQGRNADIILLHELAHQWVGNAVSPASWMDIWLNEGFATYTEWLYTERTGGPAAADMARAFAGVGELDLPAGDPGSEELFSSTVYIRGGMTLQALRERVGDEDFFLILRTWVDEHRDGAASTTDFIALAERVSSEELGELFEAWLYADRLPSLD